MTDDVLVFEHGRQQGLRGLEGLLFVDVEVFGGEALVGKHVQNVCYLCGLVFDTFVQFFFCVE